MWKLLSLLYGTVVQLDEKSKMEIFHTYLSYNMFEYLSFKYTYNLIVISNK